MINKMANYNYLKVKSQLNLALHPMTVTGTLYVIGVPQEEQNSQKH